MEKLNFHIIKKRSIQSVFALTLRTIFLQLINISGYFFITIFLERKEFGLFIIVSAIIDILGYFSDIGLAAALIQKHDKPTLAEIRSTFTIQQILVIFLISLVLIFSPLIKRFYNLDNQGLLLLYSFALAFFLSSLKTIPSVILERKLQFSKIIIPQFIEAIVFNLTVIILAWKGFGILSYTWAVFLRGLLGTITLYLIAPWPIGLNFSLTVLKSLLKFGIPYQFNTLLAVVKDKIMILVLGIIIGTEGIALVGWAEKWANMPLRYFLDNTLKVVFPAFSRLQKNKEKLSRAIESSLYFLSVLTFPAIFGICVISPIILQAVPRLLKWQPALIPLYLYGFSAYCGTISTLLTNTLTALGQIKNVFKLMIMWTALTWILVPGLSIRFGFLGTALASGLIGLSFFIPVMLVKKAVKFRLWDNTYPATLASIVMTLIIHFTRGYLPVNMLGILIQVAVGVLSYFAILILLNRKKLFQEIYTIFSYAKK